MKKGGYQIIDFHNVNIPELKNTPTNYIGGNVDFNQVLHSANKVIYITGLTVLGKKLRDCVVQTIVTKESSQQKYNTFSFRTQGYNIQIFDKNPLGTGEYQGYILREV